MSTIHKPLHRSFSKRAWPRLWAIIVFFIAAFGLYTANIFVHAQNWLNPATRPPINNFGQPPTTANISNLVRIATSTVQIVQGPVNVGQDPALPAPRAPVFFGDAAGEKISIKTTDDSSFSYTPSGMNVGVYGDGSLYGVKGNSDALSDATPFIAGIVGRNDTDASAALAGLFYGPVEVASNGANLGIITVDGAVKTDTQVTCQTASCALRLASGFWLKGTNSQDGTGVYGETIDVGLAAIDVIAGDALSAYNKPAVEGSSLISWGAVGFGEDAGIYAFANGSVEGRRYVGLAGVAVGTTGGVDGVYGNTTGGLNDTGSACNALQSNPACDIAAGLRACVEIAAGVAQNRIGVYGSGGTYAGYFDGDGGGGDVCAPGDWVLTWDDVFALGGPSAVDAIFTVQRPSGRVLYIGTGSGINGHGKIYYCMNPAADDCNNVSDWQTSYTPPIPADNRSIQDFEYDPVHNVLYAAHADDDGDGNAEVLKCALTINGQCNGGWTDSTGFVPAQEYDIVEDLLYDPVHTVLYIGLSGQAAGDGDAYYCNLGPANANGVCDPGEWALSFAGPHRKASYFERDAVHDVLYLALEGEDGADSGATGDIYRCSPGADDFCIGIGAEWVQVYEADDHDDVPPAGQFRNPRGFESLAYDSVNNILYAGESGSAANASQSSGDEADANVWACIDGTDAGALCDLNEWQLVFDGSAQYSGVWYEDIETLLFDPLSEAVYLGLGYDETESGVDNVDRAMKCRPKKDGDADGLCEISEWTDALTDAVAQDVQKLYLNPVDRQIYAGFTHGTNNADVFRCSLTPDHIDDGDVYSSGELIASVPSICADNTWHKSYDGESRRLYSLLYDSVNQVVYAGKAEVDNDPVGGQMVVACMPNVNGNANGICETTGGEWVSSFTSPDSQADDIYTLFHDEQNGIIYLGQADDTQNKCLGAPGSRTCSVTGNTCNVTGYLECPTYGNIYYCDIDNPVGLDSLRCELTEWILSFAGPWQRVTNITKDTVNGIIYAGMSQSDSICQGGTSHGSNCFEPSDKTTCITNSGVCVEAGDIYSCNPSLGDADGRCEPGEWIEAFDAMTNPTVTGIDEIDAFYFDAANEILYVGGGEGAAGAVGDGDIFYCDPDLGDADGRCEPGEWAYALNNGTTDPNDYSEIHSFGFDPYRKILYAGTGDDPDDATEDDGHILWCDLANDLNGVCTGSAEWHLTDLSFSTTNTTNRDIKAIEMDLENFVMYMTVSNDDVDNSAYIYSCDLNPSVNTDRICKGAEWVVSYSYPEDIKIREVRALAYDSANKVMYSGSRNGGTVATPYGDVWYACKDPGKPADARTLTVGTTSLTKNIIKGLLCKALGVSC